jgi:septal ring factor EnvC (AmiA/AmiB activator)
MIGDVVDVGLRVLFALGVPGAVIWYVRDRRKSRAESEVAERTVGADVRIRDVASLEAHITFVERAFGVERTSKDRQISSLEQEVRQLSERVRDRDAQIAGLLDAVAELKQQVKALTEQSAYSPKES